VNLRSLLATVGIGLFIVLAGAVAANRASIVYPTEETKSAFLKTYSPVDVVHRFKVSDRSQQLASGDSGTGPGLATHQRDIKGFYIIRREDVVPLTRALQKDILSKLQLHGGTILEQSGNVNDGYEFKYMAGQDIGKVVLHPVAVIDPPTTPPIKLRAGDENVSVHIGIEEKWYRHLPVQNTPGTHESTSQRLAQLMLTAEPD
jgi:hypothetical protein